MILEEIAGNLECPECDNSHFEVKKIELDDVHYVNVTCTGCENTIIDVNRVVQ